LREEIPVRPRDLKAINLASAGRNVAGRKKGRRVNAQLWAIGKQDGGFVRTDARFEQIGVVESEMKGRLSLLNDLVGASGEKRQLRSEPGHLGAGDARRSRRYGTRAGVARGTGGVQRAGVGPREEHA
jgi:hypothetical protein